MKQQKLLLGSMMIFIGLLAFNLSSYADIVIKNGSTMKVSSGTEVVVSTDVDVESGGTIDNSGTVTVKGDFNNDGTADLGSGGFVFDGTAAQDIGGTASEFENLTIDNSSGVTLSASAVVDGTMTLTDGLVMIGTNNLTFGTAATVAGTLDATAMIVATSTGEVRKAYPSGTSDPAAFTFPIGDNDGTAEYSPVTMDFNSSTFGAGAYASVTVTNGTHAEMPTAPDYLNRYWSLGATNITTFDCDLSFTFLDADVLGTNADKADLYTLQYVNPSWVNYNLASGNTLTADNVSSFSDWSGASRVSKGFEGVAFLDGPYNTGTNLMSTALNAYLPTAQPFSAIPSAQWYYNGSEDVPIPNTNVVDWVMVELRQAGTPADANVTTRIGQGVGFLLNDGSIVGLDGVSPLIINGVSPVTNNVYAIVFHRNHLGVMSNLALTDSDSDGSYDYDFSSGIGQVYGGAAAVNLLETGVYGLIGGDASGNGFISSTDISIHWRPQFGLAGGYYTGDFSMNGAVSSIDMSIYWRPAFGISKQYP